jgi:trans-2,3-dihydro-3-hydroxyanthranilate isomerase
MPDDGTVATALGLAPADLGFAGFRPARWSAGLPVSFIPVGRLAAVAELRPDPQRLVSAFGDSPVYLFCGGGTEPGHGYHARMFAPPLGVPEDPATGSAAAAFAGILATQGGLADGEHAIAIEQGYEMGRPSVLHLNIVLRSGKLVAASVGGGAVLVTEGTIEA